MKRRKPTNLGRNDKQLKSSKKSKEGITTDDPSLSDVGQSKENGKRGKGVGFNRPAIKFTREKGRLSSDFRGNEALTQGDLTKRTTPDIVEKEHVTKDLPPIVIGLQSNVMASSQGKKLKQLPSEKAPNITKAKRPELEVPLIPKMTGNVEGKGSDAGTISKRKRGRPPKLQAKSTNTSLVVNHQNGDAVPGVIIAAETESGKNLVHEKEQQQFPEGNNASKQKKTSESSVDPPVVHVDKPPNRSFEKAPTVQQEKYKQPVKGKRGKRRTISSINIESSTQDCQDSSKQKANGGSGKDVSTAGNSQLDTMSDDQPLSRWFAGIHPSATVDHTAASGRHIENAKYHLAVAADDTNGEHPSFEKRSSLWQTLESMQVFGMVPQRPHFRPLEGTKESLREGQAISKMVTYVSVVENTCRLRCESPRSSIEEYMEIVVDLESHGFDVRLIRNRLRDLDLVKEEQERLEGQAKEVRDKMEEEKGEGERMEKEMEMVEEQVQALMRKREQMQLKKQRKDAEIAALEAEVKEIEEGILKAQDKFDEIAAASLCEQPPPPPP